jgi:hypothetical protein
MGRSEELPIGWLKQLIRRNGIMLITIGEKTKKNMKVLGINSYPFSSKQLKQAFRNLINISHPDRENGNEEKAKKIIAAYNEIKNLALNDITENDKFKEQIKIKKKEEDIFTLFENCKECDSIGKITSVRYKEEICKYCDIHKENWSIFGIYQLRKKYSLCKDCKGTGEFTQKRGKTVDCYKCQGTGLFGYCKHCKNTGFISRKKEFVENICLNCKGTGKIELKPFNPVIKKGAILI